jgi:hypothetical protein
MFGVGVGVRVGGFTASSGGGFDPDAQAFFDRVTTAGGSLTTTEKNATNQLVLDMKSAGIWSSMKAVYPMIGASAAACSQNLKSSSFTGTFTSGWTFASTGVTGNGTSAYMDSGLNDNVNLSLNSAHLSIYSRTNSDGLFCDIGIGRVDTNEINLFSKFGNIFYPRIHNTNSGIANSVSSLGFFISNRVSSSEVRAFQNNTLKLITNTSGGKNDDNIFLGALNGSPIRFFTSRQYAFASIGDGLTDTQAGNFYTAVQAFQTTLSRNV